MNTTPRPQPLVVAILDGWGASTLVDGNAIHAAATPTMDSFAYYYPTAYLHAASIEVGLPWGEIGNSETGHRNIGAGEVQYQALPRIDRAIEDGSFFKNDVLRQAVQHSKQNASGLHIMGLLGPGGVHAHSSHLYALLDLAGRQDFRENVYLHLFTDGRDTPPQSALTYLDELEKMIGKHGVGKIASITGRFYAMDRNQNWERTEATYNLLTGGPRQGGASSPRQAIEAAYKKDIGDEMIPPTAITRGGGPIAHVKPNDSVIFFNFRPDRARQLTQAFVAPQTTGFKPTPPDNLSFVTMTQYDDTLPNPAAFIEEPLDRPLARVISDAGLTQLHVAETEKYAHITYYLNGGHENPFPGEEHLLVKSSSIENFADKPEMEAVAIADRTLTAITQRSHDVYFINYANADMVGHTGNYDAALIACQTVDTQLARLYEAVVPGGGAMIVTADHGNAEEMKNPASQEVETDHTSNPVPFHYVIKRLERTTPRSDEELTSLITAPLGVLADVAPTILDVLQIPKPASMTGISLLSSLQ